MMLALGHNSMATLRCRGLRDPAVRDMWSRLSPEFECL